MSNLYPIYFHKENDGSFSGIFPDIPGVAFHGSGIGSLHRNAVNSALDHFSDLSLSRKDRPLASFIYDIPDWQDYQGGHWSAVYIGEF